MVGGVSLGTMVSGVSLGTMVGVPYPRTMVGVPYPRTMVGGGYTPPGIYARVGIGPGTPPWYMSRYTLPGTPSTLTSVRPSVLHCPLTLRCRTMMPWAQRKRIPWVRGICASKSPKSVKGERAVLRVVTPVSLHKSDERLDRRRVKAHVSPM